MKSWEDTWALGVLAARKALLNRKHFSWAVNRAAILPAEKGVGKAITRENRLSKGRKLASQC